MVEKLALQIVIGFLHVAIKYPITTIKLVRLYSLRSIGYEFPWQLIKTFIEIFSSLAKYGKKLKYKIVAYKVIHNTCHQNKPQK